MAMEEVRKEIRYGDRVADWQERINVSRMRRERLARTQAAMKEHGIAALLTARGENKRYATGLRIMTAGQTGALENFALVFAEGSSEDALIVYESGPSWVGEKEHVPWVKPENYRPLTLTWFQTGGPAHVADHAKEVTRKLHADLKQRGLAKEKVGLDVTPQPYLSELEALGITVVNAQEMMMNVRSIKTEDEVECMKMGGAIVDIAYAEMIEALRPGRRECDISAIGSAALIRNGARRVTVSLRSGPNTAPLYLGRFPTDRIIQPGDMVYMDVIGDMFLGYHTCYYRVFKVGTKPTQAEKDWFKKCRDYLYAAVDVLRDGITTADVAAKWPKAAEFGYKWGYDDEAIAAGSALGHGIGLGNYEYPLITRQNSLRFPQPIKKNMTIAMETWAGQTDWEHGWRGGARLENVWRITDKGHENLYALPDDEIICPPHAIYV